MNPTLAFPLFLILLNAPVPWYYASLLKLFVVSSNSQTHNHCFRAVLRNVYQRPSAYLHNEAKRHYIALHYAGRGERRANGAVLRTRGCSLGGRSRYVLTRTCKLSRKGLVSFIFSIPPCKGREIVKKTRQKSKRNLTRRNHGVNKEPLTTNKLSK